MSNPPLRVIVVGGAGAMGRWAARTLVKLGTASRLTIADIDATRAQRLADELSGPCEAMALDATDSGAMHAAFADHDVVVNTMGPFATFFEPIFEAAIDSGRDYFDICDDWQPTLRAFDYDELAREKGVHAVVGLGGSPGGSNLYATVAAAQLDAVHELHTGWRLSGAVTVPEPEYPAGSASAAVEHWLHQVSAPIYTWENGEATMAEPLTAVELDIPGIGPVKTYTMGHPEPLTLSRAFDGLRSSLNVHAGPDWIFDHVKDVSRRFRAGEISLHQGAEELADPPRPDKRGPREAHHRLPVEWGLAIGAKGGRPARALVHSTVDYASQMGGRTGTPVAVGVELLRRGLIKDVGVHAPETAIDPYDFFDLIAPLVDGTVTNAKELLNIVVETE